MLGYVAHRLFHISFTSKPLLIKKFKLFLSEQNAELQMANNSVQLNPTEECSYKDLDPNFEKNVRLDTESDFEANTNFQEPNQSSILEDSIYEDSSDDFLPNTDTSSDSSSDSDVQQRKKKVTKKITSHVTAEESGEDQEIIEHGETKVDENETIKKTRGRKKTKAGEETRKRKRDPNQWEKNIKKKLKTQGKEYYTVKGKKRPAKSVKEPCNCRRKCFEKCLPPERQEIFKDFYNLSLEAQNQCIANLVEEQNKKVERMRKDGKESRRKYSRKYHLFKNAAMTEVCQKMFLNTLDLTLKKVRVIIEKKRSSESGICPEDRRGKHSNHPKVPHEDKEEIRTHIKMFPSYASHYSRSHTKKQYLSPDLSISKMYRLYVTHCLEKNMVPRNEALYRQIFVEEFNLAFHKPANDTCGTCDKYNLLLKSASSDEEKEQLTLKRNEHLQLANSAYEEKRSDKIRCKSNPKMVVVSFDLQKCLPTPYLTSGISFYKRKLWTLNLTLYETRGNKNSAICYLWNETIAKRGGQEIASCLFAYLKSLPHDVNEVIFYSDCCPGQTRNIYLPMMFMTVLEQFSNLGREVIISHKFLVPGHTHMEADTIHASIEKAKKTTTVRVDIPRDWANLIRMIPRTPPIVVTEMGLQDFFDFKSLLRSRFQHRKVNTSGQPVIWNKIRHIQYRHDKIGTMLYKFSFNNEEEFSGLDLLRKKTRRSQILQLTPISKEPLGIPENKLQHLRDLQPYIDANSRMYYSQFLNTLTVSSTAVDALTDDEEDFSDEN